MSSQSYSKISSIVTFQFSLGEVYYGGGVHPPGSQTRLGRVQENPLSDGLHGHPEELRQGQHQTGANISLSIYVSAYYSIYTVYRYSIF